MRAKPIRIKLTKNIQMVNTIKHLKGKFLLNGRQLLIIANYIFEETEEDVFLTELVLQAYHPQGKFIGEFNVGYIENEFLRFDLYALRTNYEYIKEQLGAFGYSIVKNEQNTLQNP